MDILQAIKERHSVRQFTDRSIDEEVRRKLAEKAKELSLESGLSIKMFFDEPKAFSGKMAHYGNFRGCKNYFAISGKSGSDEAAGYFGEQLVLFAQQLGLHSCWVAMSYSKSKVEISPSTDGKLIIVVALGYGENAGVAHKSKPMAKLCRAEGEMPDWFKSGMECAALAPTAMNQQRFFFELVGDEVKAKALPGIYTKLDLGIVKYHFEVGSGRKID